MTASDNKAVVIRFNMEFLEQGNAEVLKEIVASDFINSTAISPIPNNVEGLVHFVSLLHRGFSNIKVEIHEQVSEGDVVATRKTIHALHSGEIMGHQRPNSWHLALWTLYDFVTVNMLNIGGKTI